jgi:HSP20 family protein
MNMSRFEPWSLINVLHRDLDQIAARRYGLNGTEESGHSVADWVPAVDIVEEKERFVLRADVPGVSPDDIDVSMDKGVLTVSGQRLEETSEEAHGARRLERVNGKFYRRFTLPETANAEEITASSNNGILEVVIPKQAQVESRRITVKSA